MFGLETALPDHGTACAAAAELELTLELFQRERMRLFRLAVRVIGDAVSAEDVVQEAWMRWQRTDRSQIKNPAAFLTTTTTNLAINVIQSARHRRETATDSPVLDRADAAHDPATSAQQTGAVERTLAHLMSRLTRGELAAYLLRKGFDYPYCDIADLLGTSTANSASSYVEHSRRCTAILTDPWTASSIVNWWRHSCVDLVRATCATWSSCSASTRGTVPRARTRRAARPPPTRASACTCGIALGRLNHVRGSPSPRSFVSGDRYETHRRRETLMLNDWEKQRLEEIEHDLATDSGFMRAIDGPRRRRRRLAGVRDALDPGGVLAVALASMILTAGTSLVPALTGLGFALILMCTCVWAHAAWSRRRPRGHRPRGSGPT